MERNGGATNRPTQYSKGRQMANTHAAFVNSPIEGEKDLRIAGGSEKHCEDVLAKRLELSPCRTGYVRELTEDELR